MSNLITPSDYGQIIVPNIEIVGPRILVYPKPRVEYTTETGIVVPEAAQEYSAEGVVALVGDGLVMDTGVRVPPRVEQGDAIIYARYAGTELSIEGEKFLIISEADVRCVLTYKGKVFTLDAC